MWDIDPSSNTEHYFNSTHTRDISHKGKINFLVCLTIYLIITSVLIVLFISNPDIPGWISIISYVILSIAGLIITGAAVSGFKPSRCKCCDVILTKGFRYCGECCMGLRRYFLDSPNTLTCKLCNEIIPNYNMFLTHFKIQHDDGIEIAAEGATIKTRTPEASVIEN